MTICDTNIWYEITKESNSLKDLTLTPLSVKEIANSPKLLSKIEIVRLAVNNIFEFGNEIIIKTPLEYLLSLDNQSYDGTQPYKNLSDEFEVLCKLKDGVSFPKEEMPQLEKHIEKIRNMISESTANLQEMLVAVRKNIEDNKKQQRIDTTEITKDVIKQFVKSGTENKYNLTDSFDWTKIELFLHTLDAYFKMLETNTTMRVKDNDWIDLFNLMYVTPADKYLTGDKGITRAITAGKMKKYLIE